MEIKITGWQELQLGEAFRINTPTSCPPQIFCQGSPLFIPIWKLEGKFLREATGLPEHSQVEKGGEWILDHRRQSACGTHNCRGGWNV